MSPRPRRAVLKTPWWKRDVTLAILLGIVVGTVGGLILIKVFLQ